MVEDKTISASNETSVITASAAVTSAKPVAVVDIGTTAIRMAIAEIDVAGNIKTLQELSQSVQLGKDTFTRGVIEKSTIEDCVRILKSYRRQLEEYGITQPDQIRIVATSAIREAMNRLAFLDRIFSATGLEVEPIDEAEVNRITYLSIQPLLKAEKTLSSSPAVITEVGGGNTEVLVVQGTDVVYAHTYRL
ncbi:MAG: exopolyphosphatase, partial [Planctomycetes bacterium]|nr:exopolyphosphatase [Planctomycetota bacterium]